MPWSRLMDRPESTDRNWLTTVAADPQDHRVEVFRVAAVCDVCGKGPGFGMSVSHSHRRTNRRWNPNIQPVRAQVAPGTVRKLNVCTSCIKAGKVVRG